VIRDVLVRCVAWGMLACVPLLAVTVAVAGEREASYADVRAAAAHGDVDEVTVNGAPSGAFRRRVEVEVHWRTGPFGLFGHVARAEEVHPRRDPTGPPRVVHSVAEDLSALDPGLTVVRRPDWSTGHAEIMGWRLPTWTGLVALTLFVLIAGTIACGSKPWRATRWAWFWLLLIVPPVALVGFPLLGGPTGLFPPREPDARLTGGWAFLAAVALSALGSVVAAAVL
jgi:hypothetical protein